MLESESIVKTELHGRVLHIIMNRPAKRNALNPEMVLALKAAFNSAEQHAETRIIVLRANGVAFSAGADIEYLISLQEKSFDSNFADSKELSELFFLIYQSRKIVISMVEGAAIAGGCGLATACDFIFSVPSATFGYTEVKIGFVPAIVTYFLISKIGESHAKELLLTGELIQAVKAKEIGLVYRIIEQTEIVSAVTQFAEKLCSETSSMSIAMTKELICTLPGKSAQEIMDHSAESNARMRMTDDFKKGLGSFLRKEKTVW